MKKVIMIAVMLLVAATTNSFAQEGKPQKENFSWQKVYMDEAGIPADVQLKIDDIKKGAELKAKEIRKDGSLAEDAKKEKLKEVHKKKAEDILALLTQEQKAKIKAIKDRVKKENEGEGS